MPPKKYIPLSPGAVYFDTPDGPVPLDGVQEVEITEETDLPLLGDTPARIVKQAGELTGTITLTEEATEALRRLSQTVEKVWHALVRALERIKSVIDSGQHRRVVHLALHHRDPLVRKKNLKRLERLALKTKP